MRVVIIFVGAYSMRGKCCCSQATDKNISRMINSAIIVAIIIVSDNYLRRYRIVRHAYYGVYEIYKPEGPRL